MKTFATFFIAILFVATFYLQTNLINNKLSISLDNPECSWCESQDFDQVAFLPVNTLFLRLPAPADPDFISDLLWLR